MVYVYKIGKRRPPTHRFKVEEAEDADGEEKRKKTKTSTDRRDLPPDGLGLERGVKLVDVWRLDRQESLVVFGLRSLGCMRHCSFPPSPVVRPPSIYGWKCV